MIHQTVSGRRGKAFCGTLGVSFEFKIDKIECLRCLHAYRNWMFSKSLQNNNERVGYIRVCQRIWQLTDLKKKGSSR